MKLTQEIVRELLDYDPETGSCDGRHARLSGSLWRTLEGRYGRSEFGIRSLLVKRLGLDGLANPVLHI